jgi:cellulose synthase (UDP-forming)
VAASLRDLSISGLGLRVDAGAAPCASRLLLEARDSYGHRYALPIRVLRVQDEAGGQTLGCRFEIADEAARRQVVAFVYGDSGRWKYFCETRRVKTIGTFRAFFRLVRVGLKGSGRHAAGMVRLTLGRMRWAIGRQVSGFTGRNRV